MPNHYSEKSTLDQQSAIKNRNELMAYRRFGKTNCMLSVITLGGMRYIHGWDEPRKDVPEDMLKECVTNIESAFANGINHIETAYGYTKSEACYGKALHDVLKIPRESYHFMTKGAPVGRSATREMVEGQLRTLKMDYFDFYAWHGINTDDLLTKAIESMQELMKMRDEGLIQHIGFSTHGPASVICRAIETGCFDFVNLHYYYFNQRNLAAITLAEERGMGVFIISPNDKGGQLFSAPEKVKTLTAPHTPIQWNARYCLSHKAIHTLSFGMTQKSHHDEMRGVFPLHFPFSQEDYRIQLALDQEIISDPYAHYKGFELLDDPSGINVPEILRLRRLWKCYDMKTYASYRYNNFEREDHWYPGLFPTAENLKKLDLSRVPPHIDLKALLQEMHSTLYKPR